LSRVIIKAARKADFMNTMASEAVKSKAAEAAKELITAACVGNFDLVSECIAHGVDVDGPSDINGNSALTCASKNGHAAVVEHLLDAGADKEAKNESRSTALMCASERGFTAIVVLLLRAGAGMEIKNKYSRTPLHECAIRGDATTIQCLISAGAKICAMDRNCATPLDLATDASCRELLEHHAAVLATLAKDPAALVPAAIAYCATLSTTDETVRAEKLSLREYQVRPSFLWATPAARTAVFKWARDAFIIQLAAMTPPFSLVPDDCAGDILEYLEIALSRPESLHLLAYCSSRKAHVWVRAVAEAAVAANATAKLVPATNAGDLSTVQDCIARGADVDVRTTYGSTALMIASTKGCIAIAKSLIDAGADNNVKDRTGSTAIVVASENGHTAIVELLLKVEAGKIHRGDVCRVQPSLPSQSDKNSALMKAAVRGHTAIVGLLLDAGANAEAKLGGDKTILMNASEKGCTAVVQRLIQAGANTEAKDSNGNTALLIATRKCRIAVVELLLEAGSNVEARDDEDSNTALMIASIFGHTAVVELLLQAGANTDAKNQNGNTALMIASENGHVAVLEIFLRAGVDKVSKDNAIIAASTRGRTPVVKLLLGGSAQKGEDKLDKTALVVASRKGHTDIVELLVQHGSNEEAKNCALFVASVNGHARIVRLLLQAGANKEAKVTNGKKAVDWAEERHHTEVVTLLRQ